MTFWDLLAACWRRWPLVLAGLILTTFSAYVIHTEPGVYWAQTNMVFLSPTSSRFPNSLNSGSETLVMTAGIIAVEINDGESTNLTSSPSVTLVDEGVKDGTLVRLPNIGGQWADNFAQPVLDIQAVASTPALVLQRMAALQSEIEAALKRRQDAAGVDEFNRITLQASPAFVEVQFRSGESKRALAVTVLLGLGLTLGAVLVADRRKLKLIGMHGNSVGNPTVQHSVPAKDLSSFSGRRDASKPIDMVAAGTQPKNGGS